MRRARTPRAPVQELGDTRTFSSQVDPVRVKKCGKSRTEVSGDGIRLKGRMARVDERREGRYECVTIRLRIMSRAQASADVFRAIADPTRRAILDRLRDGPAAVNALSREFAQSRPAISKHLRVLRETHVVTEQRVGRERVYRLQPARLQGVAGWIEGYRAFWQRTLDSLKRHLEENP